MVILYDFIHSLKSKNRILLPWSIILFIISNYQRQAKFDIALLLRYLGWLFEIVQNLALWFVIGYLL